LKNFKVSTKYYPADSQNFRVRYLILHYTVADFDRSIKILKTKNSAHYLISDRDNDSIELLVSEENRAWHAGISNWGEDKGLNDTSIGIEIVNNGFKQDGKKMLFYDFPDFQIKKIGELCKDIVNRYKISPTNILAHADIAPGRKQDPGPKFPWKKLYTDYNIGMWYNEEDKTNFEAVYPIDSIVNSTTFIQNTQKDFKKLGYLIEVSGIWDSQTLKVIQTFQFHFRPQDYEGILDKETWAILQALNKKYRKKK